MKYHVNGLMDFDVEIDIPGNFSVYNSLTAIAVCRHFGVPVENIKAALKEAKVKGRVEMVKVSDEFTMLIDYAHNAMSLESLLNTLRDYNPRGGSLLSLAVEATVPRPAVTRWERCQGVLRTLRYRHRIIRRFERMPQGLCIDDHHCGR